MLINNKKSRLSFIVSPHRNQTGWFYVRFSNCFVRATLIAAIFMNENTMF